MKAKIDPPRDPDEDWGDDDDSPMWIEESGSGLRLVSWDAKTAVEATAAWELAGHLIDRAIRGPLSLH